MISDTQCGFIEGKGTTNANLILRTIAEREVNDLYVCFIDYIKAFDKGRHDEIYQYIRRITSWWKRPENSKEHVLGTNSSHQYRKTFRNIEFCLGYCSRSVCWPTKCVMKNSLFFFTPCLAHLWDQTKVLVFRSICQDQHRHWELFTLVPRLFGTTCHCLSIQPFQLLPLKKHLKTSLWHSFPPIDTCTSDGPVDVMELFLWFCS